MERTVVVRCGTSGEETPPLPAFRKDSIVAYEWLVPENATSPSPRIRLERAFLLLDEQVNMANPVWFSGEDAQTWYVDFGAVEEADGVIRFRDLYIDLLVPTDGRPYRLLDLDEFADAMTNGALSLDEAAGTLARLQRFIDRYLQEHRSPGRRWTNFPPAELAPLLALPGPFGEPVLV